MAPEIINTELWLSRPRLVAGIMTGTSVDGIDAAFVEFRRAAGIFEFELKAFETYKFHQKTTEIIYEMLNGYIHPADISSIGFLLAAEYKSAIDKLSAESGIGPESIDAIGMHGQTLWHFPNPALIAGYDIRSTFQAGSVAALAAITGNTVAGDFRAADMALGGQGAPLVPAFDFHFLRSGDKNRIALNIGGISNITVLNKSCRKNDVIAFDTGPGNYLVDFYTMKFFGLPFDAGGAIAASGKIDDTLLGMMKQIPYFNLKPPKSTGRDFLPSVIERYIEENYKSSVITNERKRDLIRTLTELTAWSIAENIRLFAPETEELIASGGGVHNEFMMERLRKESGNITINDSSFLGIPPDAKEAICFAWLAYCSLAGLPGNLPSVTGASREAVLGSVSFGA